MKKFCLFVIIICILCANIAFADWYDDYNYTDYINEIYKGGEPDYSDGDLEDKLGDSGYYADLFPEEVEDDYNDNYTYSYTPKKKDYSNLDMATRIEKESGRKAPKKYKGRWEKIETPKTSNWSSELFGAYKKNYEWKFYPEGSKNCLVLAWAIIDDKLYSFNRYGYMVHDMYDWFINIGDNLYAMSDGAYCSYTDYKMNGENADTCYKNVIPKYVEIVE